MKKKWGENNWTDDRQNEPINHRLRAGQESSNFGLPMKAVCLL